MFSQPLIAFKLKKKQLFLIFPFWISGLFLSLVVLYLSVLTVKSRRRGGSVVSASDLGPEGRVATAPTL